MDFHCLWHSTLHVTQGYEEWMFTSWHLTMSNKLHEATALSFEDHSTLQLTSWLTTSMDRPLTSVLGICEYLAPFATAITPLITGLVRWDSLWMRLGFGLAQEPLESLKHCKNAKSLRRRQQKDQETSHICHRHHPWKVLLPSWWQPQHVCIEEMLQYIQHGQRSTGTDCCTQGDALFVHSVYGGLDTLQQVGCDDERLFLFAIKTDGIKLVKKWLKMSLSSNDFPRTDQLGMCFAYWGKSMDELISFSSSFGLCQKIHTWTAATRYRMHLELLIRCGLWLKYFTCVKKWRLLNHLPFSVKIVCFVSSCGVYALDDH